MTKSDRRDREIADLAPKPPGTDRIGRNMEIISGEVPGGRPGPTRRLDTRRADGTALLNLDHEDLWTPIHRNRDMVPLTTRLQGLLTGDTITRVELQGHVLDIAARRTGEDVRQYLRAWFALRRAEAVNRAILSKVESHSDAVDTLKQKLIEQWPGLLAATATLEIKGASPSIRFAAHLDAADRRLVGLWQPTTKADRDRLESARRGEKAAVDYYEGLRHTAEDVSIRQLVDSGNDDWVTHDLVVNRRPLDVKNIRRARPDRFAEHLWPRHKKTRRDHEGVDIVGVVDNGNQETPESVVLGEVSETDVKQIRRFVNDYATSAGLPIDIREWDWRERIPGWLFEYPAEHYTKMPDWALTHDRATDIARSLGHPLPPWLESLHRARSMSPPSEPAKPATFAAAIAALDSSLLSRRAIFWLVLIYMLSHRHGDADLLWRVQRDVERHLFIGDATDFPLGLHDPMRYIWNLLLTVGELLRSNHEIVREATNFQLLGLNILKAQIGQGPWRTVLAHCGICGHWPLHVASCQTCPCSKQRLVCCDEGCRHCGDRYCKGVPYDSHAEAKAVLRRFPGWVLRKARIQPPTHPHDGRPGLTEIPYDLLDGP